MNKNQIFKNQFSQIDDKLRDAKQIFQLIKTVTESLNKKIKNEEGIKNIVRDRLIYRGFIYMELQFTIPMNIILEDIIHLTQICQNLPSATFNMNSAKKHANENKYSCWLSLFEIKKHAQCKASHQNIKTNYLNKKGGPSDLSWNQLRARIQKLAKPIRKFRDKVAAHTHPEALQLKIRTEVFRRTFYFIERILRCLYFLVENTDWSFSKTASWMIPQNTADIIIEGITREKEYGSQILNQKC